MSPGVQGFSCLFFCLHFWVNSPFQTPQQPWLLQFAGSMDRCPCLNPWGCLFRALWGPKKSSVALKAKVLVIVSSWVLTQQPTHLLA